MKEIRIIEPGGPKVLVPFEVPEPKPSKGQVLIRVEAAGVNRPDIMQRRGLYPPPAGASPIPGLEVSGTVAETGQGVSEKLKDRQVCALVSGGGYAEYCVVDSELCLPVPSPLTTVEAAGLPETFFTVWTNVFQRGRLQPARAGWPRI